MVAELVRLQLGALSNPRRGIVKTLFVLLVSMLTGAALVWVAAQMAVIRAAEVTF